jgi:hypothetical protein
MAEAAGEVHGLNERAVDPAWGLKHLSRRQLSSAKNSLISAGDAAAID